MMRPREAHIVIVVSALIGVFAGFFICSIVWML